MIEMFPFMLSLSKHSRPLFSKLLYPRIHRPIALISVRVSAAALPLHAPAGGARDALPRKKRPG